MISNPTDSERDCLLALSRGVVDRQSDIVPLTMLRANDTVVRSRKKQGTMTNQDVLYGQSNIPVGIRSRLVDNNNGIKMHILEAGFEEPGRPLILLMHGYPELAFSWRKNLLPLAAAGYHVVAPDHRGYGRSGGTDVKFDDSLWPFRPMERVRHPRAGLRARVSRGRDDRRPGLRGLCCVLVNPDPT